MHVDMVARYRVRDPAEWAFYGPKAEDVLRVEVTAAMVRSLGEMGVDRVLSDGRKTLIATATRRAQAGLDAAHSGLELSSLELTRLVPSAGSGERLRRRAERLHRRGDKQEGGPSFRGERIPQAQAEADAAVQAARAAAAADLAAAKAMPRRFWRSIASIGPTRWWFASASTGMPWSGPSALPAAFGGCRRRSVAATTDSASRLRPQCGVESAQTQPPRLRLCLQRLPQRHLVEGRYRRQAGRISREKMMTTHERSRYSLFIAAEGITSEEQSLRGLAPKERRRISVRLGAGLVGIGLLGLGTLLVHLEPDQWQIGELCRGLAAAVVGIPTLVSGLRGIVTGDTRRATDQLVAIAVLAAAATGDFVTATLIPLFLELGRLFEERSSLGARAAIDGIRALGARQAVRWRNGAEERVDPNSLVPGDEILVRPGERIAVDGTVLEGRAAVDQSAITGESLHEDVGPGSPVFAGTVALGRTAQNPGARGGRRHRPGEGRPASGRCGTHYGSRAPALRASRRGVAAAGAHRRGNHAVSSPRTFRAPSPCSSWPLRRLWWWRARPPWWRR